MSLTGLDAVTPLNTVTVKSRVDGWNAADLPGTHELSEAVTPAAHRP